MVEKGVAISVIASCPFHLTRESTNPTYQTNMRLCDTHPNSTPPNMFTELGVRDSINAALTAAPDVFKKQIEAREEASAWSAALQMVVAQPKKRTTLHDIRRRRDKATQ